MPVETITPHTLATIFVVFLLLVVICILVAISRMERKNEASRKADAREEQTRVRELGDGMGLTEEKQ